MVKGYGNRKYNFSHGPDFGQMYNNNIYPTSNDTELMNGSFKTYSPEEYSKTERRICKEVKLNASIVSELITALIEKGLILRTRKRKLRFYSYESFSTTLDALKTSKSCSSAKERHGLIEHILALATYWLR